MRFFERAEVKNALAYLRLAAVPDDDGAFLRVVNFPPRGIGARTLEHLTDAARAQGTSLWQAARTGVGAGGKSTASLKAFVELIDSMRAATVGLPLPEVVDHVNTASGLIAHYKGEKDGQDRLDNLAELVNAAQSFLREADLAVDAPIALPDSADAAEAIGEGAADPLTAFLAHAALEAGETQAAEGRPALQLMTVHAAKGLEFHTVFVTGLEEGLFPHEQSLNEFDGVEEERRLMYVAVTRAKRRLYVTHAQSRMLHGQVRYNIASRFLDELPREVVSWLSPRRQRRSAIDVDPSEWGERISAIPPASSTATPTRSPDARDRGPAWRIGQSVRHAKFGLGIIIDAEGRGGDARVQVNFRDTGVKWLALEYAKLEAA
jgi:DNA helicase-2/ATP-dependent DNA helicase PcrA